MTWSMFIDVAVSLLHRYFQLKKSSPLFISSTLSTLNSQLELELCCCECCWLCKCENEGFHQSCFPIKYPVFKFKLQTSWHEMGINMMYSPLYSLGDLCISVWVFHHSQDSLNWVKWPGLENIKRCIFIQTLKLKWSFYVNLLFRT